MQTGTIRSHNEKAWKGATVVARGMDNLTGERPVIVVQHPHFAYDLEFYADAEEGKHYNVGNQAFWFTYDQLT